MPAAIQVGQTITATPTEANSLGPVTIVPADISWAVDNPALASFVVDPATGIATFTGLADGVANVTVTDTKYNLVFTDTLTVSTAPPPPPTSIGITWGTPA